MKRRWARRLHLAAALCWIGAALAALQVGLALMLAYCQLWLFPLPPLLCIAAMGWHLRRAERLL
jgi:hypothetical protein